MRAKVIVPLGCAQSLLAFLTRTSIVEVMTLIIIVSGLNIITVKQFGECSKSFRCQVVWGINHLNVPEVTCFAKAFFFFGIYHCPFVLKCGGHLTVSSLFLLPIQSWMHCLLSRRREKMANILKPSRFQIAPTNVPLLDHVTKYNT